VDLWRAIAGDASDESPVWAAALLSSDARQRVAVWSPLVPDQLGLGLETVYEAYLVHYGRPRLFERPESDGGVLLGDYL
jgi:hypothetical protein